MGIDGKFRASELFMKNQEFQPAKQPNSLERSVAASWRMFQQSQVFERMAARQSTEISWQGMTQQLSPVGMLIKMEVLI